MVQVDVRAETTLVDVEVAPQPCAEHRDHRRIAVDELHCATGLRTLPGVERDAGGRNRVVAEDPEPLPAELVELRDLLQLAFVEGVGAALWAGAAR
ncbi:MAG TPA: hypothetical protein VFC99_14335 [Acidimicrobiia bacterium]|nr:hypothetical protein [Acidimicrobiia bacterium]